MPLYKNGTNGIKESGIETNFSEDSGKQKEHTDRFAISLVSEKDTTLFYKNNKDGLPFRLVSPSCW